MWHHGREEWHGKVYLWEAKVYQTGSQFGIDGGRVSKLWVAEQSPEDATQWTVAATYERGWLMLPTSPDAAGFVSELLERLN